jgi:DNA-nicking Smr family endonuclease
VKKGGRGLTDDERKLWQHVAARVKARRARLPADAALVSEKATPRTALAAKSATPTAPIKPRAPAPVQDRGAEKRVRRGRLEIGGTLDLHGHNQDTGRAALVTFLHGAHARGARTVIVITGVGRAGQGILKRRLPEWLGDREVRGLVSGFAQAHRSHGGEGAYYVFLRSGAAT